MSNTILGSLTPHLRVNTCNIKITSARSLLSEVRGLICKVKSSIDSPNSVRLFLFIFFPFARHSYELNFTFRQGHIVLPFLILYSCLSSFFFRVSNEESLVTTRRYRAVVKSTKFYRAVTIHDNVKIFLVIFSRNPRYL